MAEIVPLSRWLQTCVVRPDAVVAKTRSRAVNAAEFLGQAMHWRRRFLATPGSRVAIHGEDALAFAQMLFGAWHAGWQVVLPADRLPATCERLRAQVDVFVGDFPPHLPGPLEAEATIEAAGVLDPDATQLLLYTSGSTGEPIAVHKRLSQLEAELRSLEQVFGNGLDETTIAGTVSQQHIYGLLFRVLWPLAAGRPFRSERLATPEQIASAAGEGPMTLIASPAHLKRLPDGIDWTALRTRLACVISSGGPLSAEAGRDVLRLWGRSANEVFGSTETGGIAHRVGATSAWMALPGVEWRIVEGQLEVRSPHLADADWWPCADRARAKGEGFELLGRSDRIAKIEERRISLTAIEAGLVEDTLVSEARVVVMQGARSFVAAAVVLSATGRELLAGEGKRALSARLSARLRDSLDATALPKRWRFVDALPVDARGKCTERLLQQLFRLLRPPVLSCRKEVDSAEFELRIPAELAVFDGHFPGTPVVPGVALVDWAIHFARSSFDVPTSFRRADVLKFQALIRPDTALHLRLDWRSADATLAFRYDSALGPHASGRLLFQADEA